MFLKVLSLFEDLFIDLVAVDRGVSMVREHDDEVHLQFSLDVGALAPVGILGLVVDNDFYLF